MGICWVLTICLTKISILLFYAELFPSRVLRIASYLTTIVTTAFAVETLVIGAWSYSQYERHWDHGLYDGHFASVDYDAQYAQAAINVALDVIIILIPQPVVWKLQMSRRKKLNVSIVFSFGLG